MINLGSKLGLDPEEIRTKYPRESENPFDSDRKLMSTKHTIENVPTMIVKGAVDVLLTRMDQIQIGSEVRPMTEQDRKISKNKIRHFQDRDSVFLLLHIKQCQTSWN